MTIIYTMVYTFGGRKVIILMTAKVFENGRSQAVRLPKEYRFDSDEVLINKIGQVVLLMPKSEDWESFIQALDMFSKDYMSDGRANQGIQDRDDI